MRGALRQNAPRIRNQHQKIHLHFLAGADFDFAGVVVLVWESAASATGAAPTSTTPATSKEPTMVTREGRTARMEVTLPSLG